MTAPYRPSARPPCLRCDGRGAVPGRGEWRAELCSACMGSGADLEPPPKRDEHAAVFWGVAVLFLLGVALAWHTSPVVEAVRGGAAAYE